MGRCAVKTLETDCEPLTPAVAAWVSALLDLGSASDLWLDISSAAHASRTATNRRELFPLPPVPSDLSTCIALDAISPENRPSVLQALQSLFWVSIAFIVVSIGLVSGRDLRLLPSVLCSLTLLPAWCRCSLGLHHALGRLIQPSLLWPALSLLRLLLVQS